MTNLTDTLKKLSGKHRDLVKKAQDKAQAQKKMAEAAELISRQLKGEGK